jgi:glycosyltransferase involved in cell wall biosynthesis
MRVAIIAEVFLPKVDGVVHRTVNLIEQLVRSGDEVVVVCPQAEGCGKCSVPVVAVPSFSFLLYPEYRIALPDARLVRALKDFRPEVLHFVNPFAFGFRCHDLLQRRGLHLPSVFSFHTLYGEFVKQYRVLRPLSALLWWMMREYHNRADRNITVSSLAQQELARRGFERVHLWPPAVDSRLFHPGRKSGPMRARLAGGHSDRRLLLTVSRLAPEKNVAFLADVLDHFPDACLAVVGDGPHRAALERRFAGKAAHFVGYLKGVQLAQAYASADAFVYASETETMGNVVLEAMACGCPVVAPRAGGIPSLVAQGQTGLLYAPGNLQDAVQGLRTVLEDEAYRCRLSQTARAVVEGWSWASSVEAVRAVYREAIQEFRHTASRLTLGQHLAQGVLTTLVSAFAALAKDGTAAAKSFQAAPRHAKVLEAVS